MINKDKYGITLKAIPFLFSLLVDLLWLPIDVPNLDVSILPRGRQAGLVHPGQPGDLALHVGAQEGVVLLGPVQAPQDDAAVQAAAGHGATVRGPSNARDLKHTRAFVNFVSKRTVS